jgi:hypothetical protein
MMNEIFQDLITEDIISVYLDDILIFTNSLEEHHQITRLVQTTCTSTNCTCNRRDAS